MSLADDTTADPTEGAERLMGLLKEILDNEATTAPQKLAAATALDALERGDYETAGRMIDYMVS